VSAPKLPRTPPPDLASRSADFYDWPVDRPFWTIAAGSGPYSCPFGTMRTFGPLRTARFDPHPMPASSNSGEEALYAATDLLSAIGERYQRQRAVHISDPTNPVAYSWFPTRSLHLVDLSGPGAVRLGASHVINTGPRSVCRTWARAIRLAWANADGIRYSSSMTGLDCAVLWAPARNSFPAAPDFAEFMSAPAPAWQALIQGACVQLGYDYWP
jgi:hypothetical protein